MRLLATLLVLAALAPAAAASPESIPDCVRVDPEEPSISVRPNCILGELHTCTDHHTGLPSIDCD